MPAGAKSGWDGVQMSEPLSRTQIGRVHDLIKIILISYCMIDNDNKLIVICFGLKS